ncbi:MAG: hypothetical protein QME42_05935 [bacterium]|nr:hypothetical protein [bacterium]
MIKRYLFLILFIPLNVWAGELLEKKLVIDKEKMTSSAQRTPAYTQSTPVEKTFTSPYQSLSQGDTSLLKPISQKEEKMEEMPKIQFQVVISYEPRLEFDEDLYHEIQREIEKIARLEKKELEERKARILFEKQRLVEEEETKIKELKVKIAKEEKERFEEKIGLIDEEIEQELVRRKQKLEEEKRIKELAARKLEEEERIKEEEKKKILEAQRKAEKAEIETRQKAEQERKIKELEAERKVEQERKIEGLEAKRKTEEERIAKQKEQEEQVRLAREKKEAEELRKKALKEEEKRKREEEEKKLAKYQEVNLDKILDRELPAGSRLTIDGTKIIDIKAGNSQYLDSRRRKNKENTGGGFTSGINIHQELTVRLQGVVKERINVNVDYSDVNSNKKQNFSINYQGDQREVVQNVKFGDVTFTAPGTEFVGYNSQVFGVSAEAKVGNKIKLWGIASRSKGLRVTKEFKGDKKTVDINRTDTSYTAQKYYCLAQPWLVGTNTPFTLEAVYIDDGNGNNNNPPKYIGEVTANVFIPGVGMSSYTGCFDIQYEGEDYIFDSGSGILTFKQSVGRNYIVGVVFKDSLGNYFPPIGEYSGNKYNPMTILMIEPGVARTEYDVFEQRNYYYIGKNIPTDTPLELKIIDNAGKNYYDNKAPFGLKGNDEYYYLQIFGLDNNGDGKIDNDSNYDYIDHDAGIIKFPDSTPFNLIGTESNPFLNAHLNELKDALGTLSISYNPSDTYDQRHKYTILGSYTTKVKSYTLGYLNIVPGSEQIYVAGKLLTKDTDYFIDYDTGFLTFMPHINITESTTIKIDYEYTPFIGTKYQETIAGVRGEWTPNNNFLIGSTFLYKGAPKLTKVPKVDDPMLGNLQVIGVNTSVKLSPVLKNLFNFNNNLPVDIIITGEVAKSFKNKNSFDLAIIDSMEGVEDARKIIMSETAWQLSSLPETDLPRAKLWYCKNSEGNLMTSPPRRNITEISGPYDYKENIKWEEDDTVDENVLRLNYTEFGPDSWISVVQPLSNVPLDWTDYTHLEIWLRDQDINKMDELYIDLGEVSENADGTERERPPKKEDRDGNAILNKDEDTGWVFSYSDATTQVGPDNNQLDTEDLDGNGVLTTQENCFVLKFKEFTEGTVSIRSQIGDWRLWSIPLSKAEKGSLTQTPKWNAIKQIRLRFKGTQTSAFEGEIRLGGIALVGSGRWIIGTVTPAGKGTFTVSSKNAEDDFYSSIRYSEDYKKLYPDEDMKREEALVLKYELEPAAVGTTTTMPSKGYTYRTFHTKQNYNDYKYLKFWVYGDNQGGLKPHGKFFIRFGLNENNYFGYTLPINFSGWQLISVNLSDFKNELIKLIEEGKRKGTATPPYNYTQLPFGYEAKNSPNFDNIVWISVGVENTSTTQPIMGEIYVNDIHLEESQKAEGLAGKIAINTKFKDYLSLDWSEKIINSEFECLGRAPQKDETKRQDITVNFTKINFLPLNYQWYENISELDPTKGTNLLNDNSGQTTEKYQKVTTALKLKQLVKKLQKFPDITINSWADRKTIDTDRRNKKENEIYGNLHGDTSYVYNYTFPKKVFKWIPTGEDLSLSSTYKHSEDLAKKDYKIENTKNERMLTRNQDEVLTLKFTPIKTLKGASSLKVAQTSKKITNISQDDTHYYLTSRTLEQSFNRVVYSGIPFVSPRFDTGMKYVESYKGTSTNRAKNINTTARFGVTTESVLNPFEWFPKAGHWPRYKLLTFTPEFSLDVTANYNNISTELGSFECIKKIYKDYYQGQLLKGEGPKTGQYPSFGGERTSAGNKRKYELRSNWYPKWKAVERTALTYTRTDDKTQNQSSLSKTLTDSYVTDTGINLLTVLPKYSQLLGTSSSDRTYFNTKYTWTKTESNQTTIKTDINPSLTWNRKWREGLGTIFTLSHQNSKTKKQGGLNDFVVNTSPSFQIKHDIKRPKPVKLLFGRKITLQRKLETTTIFKINLQKEGTNNRVTKNLNAYSVNMTGSYELQKNVKSTLGGKLGYTRNKLEKDKDFYGYEAGFRVTFTF